LIDGLQRASFEPLWLMNHDGKFGDFFTHVRERGALPPPLKTRVAPPSPDDHLVQARADVHPADRLAATQSIAPVPSRQS
jgi:hypothetical protein